MAAADLRNNIISLVQLIASPQQQVAYEHDVPVANVPAELRCMWFDDLYHPDGNLFIEAFNERERNRLARFNSFYDARKTQLPSTLIAMHASEAWREIMSEASRVLVDIGWSAGA